MTVNNDIFAFGYITDGRGRIRMEIEAPDDGFQPWTEVLDRFVDFLESVYGYDIKSHIRLQYSSAMDVGEFWRGGFFDLEEDNEDEPYDEYDQKENAGLTE